jgi:uncharacterized protein (TIGR03000 family)
MYSMVLVMALSNGAQVPAWDAAKEHPGQVSHELYRHRRGGCSGGGCYGGGYGGCWGGGYGGCHGGGYWGGGCSGGGYASGGCWGSHSYGGYWGGGYGTGYGGMGYYSSYSPYQGYPMYYGGMAYPGGGYYDTGVYGPGSYTPGTTSGTAVTPGTSYPGPSGTGSPGGRGPGTLPSGPSGEPRPSSTSGSPPPEEASAGSNTATLVVSLPPDAKLMIDDHSMISTGTLRAFITPPLTPGKDYGYDLKAEAMRNGETVTATKHVIVRAGQQTRIALNFPSEGATQR